MRQQVPARITTLSAPMLPRLDYRLKVRQRYSARSFKTTLNRGWRAHVEIGSTPPAGHPRCVSAHWQPASGKSWVGPTPRQAGRRRPVATVLRKALLRSPNDYQDRTRHCATDGHQREA